jgi:hypothetical protein
MRFGKRAGHSRRGHAAAYGWPAAALAMFLVVVPVGGDAAWIACRRCKGTPAEPTRAAARAAKATCGSRRPFLGEAISKIFFRITVDRAAPAGYEATTNYLCYRPNWNRRGRVRTDRMPVDGRA